MDSLKGPVAIGRPGGIAQVDIIIARQLFENRPENGKPAIPGIKDPNGFII
jgi:hypothetical protein